MAGIVIRFILLPFFEVGYDSDCWATIIRNLESGYGLYDLEGYFYTPPWGYMLSVMAALQEMFLNIDVMGIRLPEAFVIEGYSKWFSSMVTSVEFNVWMKAPFIISDLLVGYLVYWIIKDKTSDMRKATIGFALWFLCPLTIGLTSVSGMFDTYSVLFFLLCVIMLRKDKLFLAGILFSFAVLMKFFPVFLIFLLLVYILVKHRSDGKAMRSIILAMSGALLAAVVLLFPQIINGELMETLTFMTSRAGVGLSDPSLWDQIVSKGAVITYVGVLIAGLFIAYKVRLMDPERIDDNFFKYALLTLSFVYLYPPAPQYLLLIIPFLAIYLVTADHRFKLSWLLISLGGALFICSNNFTLLLSAAVFTDLISIEYVMSMIESFFTSFIADISVRSIMYYGAGALQYIGVISVIVLFYIGWRKKDGTKGSEETIHDPNVDKVIVTDNDR